MKNQDVIKLAHGSGGLLSSRLIKDVVLKYFRDREIKRLDDSAELALASRDVAFTTDSYVIHPIFFPGGDIGKLAICGTINDLAMQGALPKYISISLIIEEGFPLHDLERILKSASQAAKLAHVRVVCGDTKVVERGKADKIFITTSGVGIIRMNVGKEKIRPGDRVLVSGTIGDHGIAVMNERLHLGLRTNLKSDVAPLNLITNKLLTFKSSIRCMRDPTRGGVASVLNEIVDTTRYGIMIQEKNLPLKREVIGATDILGIDPLYVANEGKFIAIVAKNVAEKIVKKIKSHPLGRDATIIGEVVKEPRGVWLKTTIGGTHPLMQLEAEGLPRIC